MHKKEILKLKDCIPDFIAFQMFNINFWFL